MPEWLDRCRSGTPGTQQHSLEAQSLETHGSKECLKEVLAEIYNSLRMPMRPLRHVRAIAPTWRTLERSLEPEEGISLSSGLEPEVARMLLEPEVARMPHLVRAIAPTMGPLERPEAKEAQQEPKWTIHG